MYIGGGYEDLEGEDDLKSEFICPFCAEVFDIVGLCCHIDEEHPVEVKNGVINESSSNPSLKMLLSFGDRTCLILRFGHVFSFSFVRIVTKHGFLF